MKKPVWFLDIDGTINIMGRPHDYWPEWLEFDYELLGKVLPITVSTGLIDEIEELHHSGAVEVIWCSDWQQHANDLGVKLGMPKLRYIDWQKAQRKFSSWYKSDAIRYALDKGYRVIWTDDDITSRDIPDNPNLLAIRPSSYNGLLIKHLRTIKEWI